MRIRVRMKNVEYSNYIFTKADISKQIICIRDHYPGGNDKVLNSDPAHEVIRRGTKAIVTSVCIDVDTPFFRQGRYAIGVSGSIWYRPMNAWRLYED